MAKVLIYGDVSLNIIDGSSIWLTSISQTLTHIFDEVHVLLKAPRLNNRLVRILDQHPAITVHSHSPNHSEDPLPPRKAAQRVAGLNAQLSPEAIIIRGSEACLFASGNPHVSQKLWSYVTDLPFPPSKISSRRLDHLNRIAKNSFRMFAQTESARAYLEGIAPAAAGKTRLLNPMIPDHFFNMESKYSQRGEPLKLIYSGKFAKDWLCLEMLELPKLLKERGVNATLTMVGDKFQKDKNDPTWHIRMKDKLESYASVPEAGIIWKGGLPREEALAVVAQSDLGISWRAPIMDSSLEISTKLLEYAATGTPVIANRCEQHEKLFGHDYPLWVKENSAESVADLIANISRESIPTLGRFVKEKIYYFSESSSAARLKNAFERSNTLMKLPDSKDPIKIVVASHDFKFMGELLEYLRSSPLYEVKTDVWKTLHSNDEARSTELVNWADVVFCEWCGPNALWYSQHKKNNQKLIVRLHRFEVNGPWMQNIDFSKIDKLVFVSDMQKKASLTTPALSKTDVKTEVIPNVIDTLDLDREKSANANFHIGVLGFVPFLKRPDRALDLLENLLKQDSRYTLHFRGRMPWEYSHEWKNPLQQQLYLDFFARLRNNEELRNHVIFEPFGADVGTWFRKIGIILSPSSYESFHLATAEGMASGSFPIVWDRAGAKDIFGPYVFESIEDSCKKILELRNNETFLYQQKLAKEYASRWDSYKISNTWSQILK